MPCSPRNSTPSPTPSEHLPWSMPGPSPEKKSETVEVSVEIHRETDIHEGVNEVIRGAQETEQVRETSVQEETAPLITESQIHQPQDAGNRRRQHNTRLQSTEEQQTALETSTDHQRGWDTIEIAPTNTQEHGARPTLREKMKEGVNVDWNGLVLPLNVDDIPEMSSDNSDGEWEAANEPNNNEETANGTRSRSRGEGESRTGENLRTRLLTNDRSVAKVEDTLIIFHPTTDTFDCPFPECPQRYKALNWTVMRQSLLRHITTMHNAKLKTTHICRKCETDIGIRPSTHQCLHVGPINMDIQLTPRPQAHKCRHCEATFVCNRALTNHVLQHTRREVRQRLDDKLPAPNTRHARKRKERPQTVPGPEENDDRELSQGANSHVLRTPPEERESENSRSPTSQHGDTQQLGPPQHLASPDNNPSFSPSSSRATPSSSHPTSFYTPSSPPPLTQGLNETISQRRNPEADLEEAEKPTLLSSFQATLDHIQQRATNATNWNEFTRTMEEIGVKVRDKFKIKPPGQHHQARPPTTATKDDPKTIQRLYATNRRRAMRIIQNEDATPCPIPLQDIRQHFLEAYQEVNHTMQYEDRPAATEIDTAAFTTEEVQRRLRKFENSSPGPDRICYIHWKRADPEAKVLTKIYNICLKYKKIPVQWKRSRTALIMKKGQPDNISNWRPIALSNTIYKLYAGCLQARLSRWITDNSILSHNQKAFAPLDGVIEHNYKLEKYLGDARKGQREAAIVWLDLSNAFGSVPKQAISMALLAAGAGESYTNIITDLYEDEVTYITSPEGQTEPLEVRRGIKQGCPLSGPLFNLTIDPIIREATGDKEYHDSLAYADDIVIIRKKPEELQQAINQIKTSLERLCIKINIRKCKSLTVASNAKVLKKKYSLGDEEVEAMGRYDRETFLGKPLSFTKTGTNAGLGRLTEIGINITKSKLAPWQRIDALKGFFYPALLFHMRTGNYNKKDWIRLDNILRAEVKKTLNLPDEATNAYIYGPTRKNLIGIPCAAETAEVALVDTAYKLLTSPDPAIREFANKDVQKATIKRGGTIEPHSMAAYLSGSLQPPFDSSSHDISTVWSKARRASRALKVEWTAETNNFKIRRGDKTIGETDRRNIFHHLRVQLQEEHHKALSALKSQGKTFPAITQDKASGRFIAEGKYISFADWRFIHRARLNTVPLNARNRRGGDAGCRRCENPQETLPHVLQHCMLHSHLIQQRHNAIVDRLIAPLRHKGFVTTENRRAIATTNLRPDIVAQKPGHIHLFDVTVTFENGPEAYGRARTEKLTKYETLRAALQADYEEATIEPIVVGALGSWDPNNDRCLRRIMTRRYLNKFKELVVAETIKWSRTIYMKHLTGR